MAGPIQKALSGAVGTASAIAVAGKKLKEDERQAKEKEANDIKAQEEAQNELTEEAKSNILEADLIRMGANPESARAFINARELGLDTKSFGMIRKKGKFIGSYSSLADKLSKDAVTDSLSSKLLNKKGFADRVMKLGSSRKGRVEALVKADGGKKDEK